MKFSSNEDIAASIDKVFAFYSDFDGFERSALRRGADVARTDKLKAIGEGCAWKASFKFRGRQRAITGEIVEYIAPEGYSIDAQSPNLAAMFQVELMPLSKNRTRVSLIMDIKPKSLSGRLMVQSMKLAKTRLTRRFKVKASEFARNVEDELVERVTA